MISALRQKSKFEFRTFLKKNPIFGFPWCSTREDLSIDVSITNVGLILTKLWWYLFSGCGQTEGQTDTVLESSHGNMLTHKKFQLKAQNLWLAVDPYMPPRRTGMHNKSPYRQTVWSIIALTCVRAYDRMLQSWTKGLFWLTGIACMTHMGKCVARQDNSLHIIRLSSMHQNCTTSQTIRLRIYYFNFFLQNISVNILSPARSTNGYMFWWYILQKPQNYLVALTKWQKKKKKTAKLRH